MNKGVIFLDYDGVINIGDKKFDGQLNNPEAIMYLNKFCNEFNFDIVVTSSWRRHPNYKNMLYNAGLDPNIKIAGCTIVSHISREFEINKYLSDNPDIIEFIIIDDYIVSGDLHKYLVHTSPSKGFNKNKYIEAVSKMDILYNKRTHK